MDYNYKFVEMLKEHQNATQVLQIAVEVILQEKNYRQELEKYRDTLTREDKVLKEFAIRSKQEQEKSLQQISKIDSRIAQTLQDNILPAINFDRRLNNYCFIKQYNDPQNSVPKKSMVVEAKQKMNDNFTCFEGNFTKLEWKLEITLSTIKMKKVVRPLILLIFHTKSGVKKSMYLDLQQFSEMRKNVALTLKQLHLIESL